MKVEDFLILLMLFMETNPAPFMEFIPHSSISDFDEHFLAHDVGTDGLSGFLGTFGEVYAKGFDCDDSPIIANVTSDGEEIEEDVELVSEEATMQLVQRLDGGDKVEIHEISIEVFEMVQQCGRSKYRTLGISIFGLSNVFFFSKLA